MDVVGILTKSGQVKLLAERHDVDTWDVAAVLGEFVDYWTPEERPETEEPGRDLRTRGQWLLDAQKRVAVRAREGFLRGAGRAPGLEAHAARTGRTLREVEQPTPRKHDPWAWQWAPGGPLYGKPRPTTGPEADPNRQPRRANGHG